MNIIHIYDGHERVSPGEGSVPTVVYKLAYHVANKGHNITVLERRWKGLDYREERDGVKFRRIDLNIGSNIPYREVPYEEVKKPQGIMRLLFSRSEFAFKVKKILEKNEFDIIHVHLPFSSSILVNLNRKLRDKMVYTAHVGEERKRFALDSSAPLVLKLFSPDLYLMKRIRKSVVLNEPLKEKLVKKGIKEESLEVIPNGVNVEDFNVSEKEVGRVRKKYRLEGIIVMFTGTVTSRKGVLQLIRAGEISNLGKDVLFLIVGNLNLDREYATKVMKYAKSKGINAKFTGFVPYKDLKALYSACDVFILPSFEEGHGISLTEAMVSGKPLIGSNVGGIPMQIRDGWNGFLVEPGNEKQLAEKIRYLFVNEGERIKMGRNSRKLAEEEFSWGKIAERYLEVYEEVAK
jgi:glycosyltransferase involved in cell wall biosynthesis